MDSMTGTGRRGNRMAEHKFSFFKFWLATEWRFGDWAAKLLFTTALFGHRFDFLYGMHSDPLAFDRTH